jgi:PmbA protein
MNKQKWIDHALKKGFDSFEIYQNKIEEKNITYYEREMESYVKSHVLGTALRGLYHGKMASISTEDPSDENMEKLIATMIEQAEATTSADSGIILEPITTEETVKEDPFITPDVSRIDQTFKQIEDRFHAYDERVFQVTDLFYTEQNSSREISNSRSMHVKDASKVQAVVAGVAVKDKDEIKNAYNIELLYDIDTFDTDAFVKKTADKALNKLHASSIPSGTYPVIIDKDAMGSLFTAFSGIFSGDLIGKGISPLKDKLNEKIFSEKVSVIDDPRNTDALMICNYDDEGYPTSKKTLVDGGIFKTMLHSTSSAMRMQMESTGNGFKQGYDSPVGVRPYSCYIVPGERTFDELLKEMNEGLVIESFQGLHAGINLASTNFSLQCNGYYVKDGKRDKSVTLITAAANFLELMRNVREVGNDLEWKTNTIACPSILFNGIAISGE